MTELIKKIDWKSTKGITLITVVGILVFGILFTQLSEEYKNYAYIIFVIVFILIIIILSPSQTIEIGEDSKVDATITQTKTDIGKQKIKIKKNAKIKKKVEQK